MQLVGRCSIVAAKSHRNRLRSELIEALGLASFLVQCRERFTVASFFCQVQLTLHQLLDVFRHIGNQVSHEPRQEEHKVLSQTTDR